MTKIPQEKARESKKRLYYGFSFGIGVNYRVLRARDNPNAIIFLSDCS